MNKEIKVYNPSNLKVIEYTKLEDFQGDLKTITKENLEKLKKSIIEHGFAIPKFVWINEGHYYILDGHQSKKALIELEKEGYRIPKIPYCEIYAENKKKAKEILLLINSRYGEMADKGLFDFIEDSELNFDEIKADLDFPEIDFDIFENKFYNDTEDDEDIPEEVKSIIKQGDLIELGRHRLLCGDCTVKENVDRLMDGEKADVVFTDPPYGLGIQKKDGTIGGGGIRCFRDRQVKKINVHNFKKIIGDDKEFDPRFLLNYGKNQIIWGGNHFANKLPNSSCWLIWDKREGLRSNKFSDCEICWTSFSKVSRIYSQLWSGLVRRGNRTDELISRIHPSQKAIGVCEKIIKDYSKENEIILDLFMVSGSILIACEKTGRICMGMEIDEYYCDVIIQRYKDWMESNKREYKIKINGKEMII